MIAVSLSWAVVVDLVPEDARPYIGSSRDNSVISLIMEHNGGSRLASGGGPQNAPRGGPNPNQNQQPQTNQRPGGAPPAALAACANLTQDAACSFTLQNGRTINGTCINAPNSNALACAPQNMIPQQNAQSGQPQQTPRQGPPQEALDACANLTQGAACSFTMQFGDVNGTCIIPPNSEQLACAPQGMNPPGGQQPGGAPNQGSTPFNNETGDPGVFRFFTSPLSKQMSWLLPFALISIALSLFASKIHLPVEAGAHKALILWGGWLLTCVIFFSAISGIFHSYYAIMLVPPLGAMVGVGFALLWSWSVDREWVSGFLFGSVVITLAFQTFAIFQYEERSLWMFGAALLFGLGIMLVGFNRRAAYLLILCAMLVIPAYWTLMTVATSADQNLPSAYSGGNANQGPRMQNIRRNSNLDEEMLTMLQNNTQDVKYLLAVPSSNQGAEIVLATGRPVLYMGGFNGNDDVVNVDDLKSMVANGELRYILYGGERGNKQDIRDWLQNSCVNMVDFTQTDARGPQPPNAQGPGNQLFLYRCE
jgi:4-amino-4-deoxy-L-arabinose transferase-like glycosyltransferase